MKLNRIQFFVAGLSLAAFVPAVHGAETAAALAPAVPVPAVEADAAKPEGELPGYVVSATRTPELETRVANSVSVVEADQWQDRQQDRFQDVLAANPGVIVLGNGQPGSGASIFTRGTSSNHTLLVADGIPVSDPNAEYNYFLGGSPMGGYSRMEVLRGPQSAVYGGSAIGGIVALETAKGKGEPTVTLKTEAGSFSTFSGGASSQGSGDGWAYNVGGSYLQTDNDREFSEFRAKNAFVRTDVQVNKWLSLGVIYRGLVSEMQSPGDLYASYPDEVETWYQSHWTTLFAEGNWERLGSRLAYSTQNSIAETEGGFGVSDTHTRRQVVDWSNKVELSETVDLHVGTTLEKLNHEDFTEDNQSVNGLVEWEVIEGLVLGAGGRHDWYQSWDDANTYRLTAAYWLDETETKLRASYGTAFMPPSLLNRFGNPGWGQLANPDIGPEKSKGWDVGFDQYFDDKRGVVGVTYFRNEITDLLEWKTLPFWQGMMVNSGEATSQGVEVSASYDWTARLSTTLAYTYTDARNDEGRLIRRPLHQVSGDVNYRFTKRLLGGFGATFVAGQLDRDYNDWTTVKYVSPEDYIVCRTYAAYEITDGLLLKVRIENLFDKEYQPIYGFPAPGIGAFAGIEWTF